MTNTSSLCQILGGLRKASFNTMKSHEKTIPTEQQDKKSEREMMGTFIECRRFSRTIESAQQTCKRLYHEYTANTGSGNKPITPEQQVRRRRDQQFEGLEEYKYRLGLVQDGDSILPPGRRIHLRYRTGNKAVTGSQIEAGIRGKHHPGLNSNRFFFLLCSEMSFRLPVI